MLTTPPSGGVGALHVPSSQVASALQTLPQEPQFAGSREVSMQLPLHEVMKPPPQTRS
jgi:hypothetical protein